MTDYDQEEYEYRRSESMLDDDWCDLEPEWRPYMHCSDETQDVCQGCHDPICEDCSTMYQDWPQYGPHPWCDACIQRDRELQWEDAQRAAEG